MKIFYLIFFVSIFLFLFQKGGISLTNHQQISAKPVIEKVNIIQQRESIVDTIFTILINLLFLSGLIYSVLTFSYFLNYKKKKINKDFFNLNFRLKPLRLIFEILILTGVVSFVFNIIILIFQISKSNYPFYISISSNINNLSKVLKYSTFCGVFLIFIYILLESWLEKRYRKLNKN